MDSGIAWAMTQAGQIMTAQAISETSIKEPEDEDKSFNCKRR